MQFTFNFYIPKGLNIK